MQSLPSSRPVLRFLFLKAYARAGLAVVTAGGVLVTAVACGRGGDYASSPTTVTVNATAAAGSVGSPSAPPSAKGGYVALGDSYTSGPGIPDRTGTPTGCQRSDRNYPSLVAESLGIKATDFRDMSCSGATIGDLSGAQSTDDGTNPAQLSALSSGTRLVTIGIGGNDIGFSDLVEQCTKSGIVYYATGSGKYTGSKAPCRGKYVSGGTDQIQQRILTAGARLADALKEVKQRAPQARVYIVGYPAILPSQGSDCGLDMGLAPGDVTFLNQEVQQLNTTLKQRAQAVGAGYVDTYTPSVGHDACSAPKSRWIEPFLPLAPAAPVHPNERGERGMAEAVLRAVDG
ncbi:SGNH/GDSL hydrolase family protein [Streptacidiphilus sp. N1-10]|uniref:SGNH/GDSL hydrolase family protein n=1 Tax=Streptacidiphilus jeojiensis TaxID=3229225 RepID=A0ABV6XHH4_9ACTN